MRSCKVVTYERARRMQVNDLHRKWSDEKVNQTLRMQQLEASWKNMSKDAIMESFDAACGCGDLESVKRLLADPRVDPADDHMHCLIAPILSEHLEVLKTLLADPRVDPSARDNVFIYMACKDGSPEVVKLLLRDCRVKLKRGRRPYAFDGACDSGNLNVLRVLLADSRSTDYLKTERPLERAVCCPLDNVRQSVVDLLLEDERIDPSADENKALQLACDFGDLRVIKQIVKHKRFRPGASREHHCFLERAFERGDYKTMEAMLAYEFTSRKCDNECILRMACATGNRSLVKELIEVHKCDPAAKRGQCLYLACKNGHADVARMLLTYESVRPRIENEESVELLAACEGGHAEVVRLLLEHPEVNPNCKEGLPLLVAIRKRHAAVARAILSDRHFQPNRCNGLREACCTTEYNPILDILLADGRFYDYSSAVEEATINGNLGALRVLLEHSDSAAVALGTLAKASSSASEDCLMFVMQHRRTRYMSILDDRHLSKILDEAVKRNFDRVFEFLMKQSQFAEKVDIHRVLSNVLSQGTRRMLRIVLGDQRIELTPRESTNLAISSLSSKDPLMLRTLLKHKKFAPDTQLGTHLFVTGLNYRCHYATLRIILRRLEIDFSVVHWNDIDSLERNALQAILESKGARESIKQAGFMLSALHDSEIEHALRGVSDSELAQLRTRHYAKAEEKKVEGTDTAPAALSDPVPAPKKHAGVKRGATEDDESDEPLIQRPLKRHKVAVEEEEEVHVDGEGCDKQTKKKKKKRADGHSDGVQYLDLMTQVLKKEGDIPFDISTNIVAGYLAQCRYR